MHAFAYESPQTLAEAVALLARHNGEARPFAGGTDLLDQMRNGRLTPQVLIDIKKIPELMALTVDAQGLTLGAAVPCYRVYGDARIAQHYAALVDSCHIIGGVQIQSRASVGGNLCNAGPAADTIPSLIALGATCVILGAQGTRDVAVQDFCLSPGKSLLQPGELLVAVKIPAPAANSGSHYRRLIPRNEMDIAVVGVAAAVQLDDSGQRIVTARIGLGAVAPTPLFAVAASEMLAGQPVSDQLIEAAAKAAQAIAAPITDMRGTKEYRLHVTGVLVRRVLHAAIQRARGQQIEYRPGHG